VLVVAGFEDLTGIPTAGSFGAHRRALLVRPQLRVRPARPLRRGDLGRISDRLEITGGLRYYEFDEDRTQTFDGIFADDRHDASARRAPTASRRASSPAIR
jgi:hypothetical protein